MQAGIVTRNRLDRSLTIPQQTFPGIADQIVIVFVVGGHGLQRLAAVEQRLDGSPFFIRNPKLPDDLHPDVQQARGGITDTGKG